MQSFLEFYKLQTVSQPSDFTKTVTTTDAKLEVIKWENANFKAAYPKRGKTEAVLGLVGHKSQLERHIKQYVDLGFAYQNIYIADFDRAVVAELKQAVSYLEKRGYIPATDLRSRIMYGNVLNMVKEVPNVTHVDCDGTAPATELEMHVKAISSIPTVKTFCIVLSNRSGKLLYDFNTPKAPQKNPHLTRNLDIVHNAMRQNITNNLFNHQYTSNFKRVAASLLLNFNFIDELRAEALKKHPQFECAAQIYRGKHPMVSFIFSRGTNAFKMPKKPASNETASYMLTPLEKLITINKNIRQYPNAVGTVRQRNFIQQYMEPIFAALYDVVKSGELDDGTTRRIYARLKNIAKMY